MAGTVKRGLRIACDAAPGPCACRAGPYALPDGCGTASPPTAAGTRRCSGDGPADEIEMQHEGQDMGGVIDPFSGLLSLRLVIAIRRPGHL